MSPVTAGAVDTFPNRPIRLIVPYPPGGGTDIVGFKEAEASAANFQR